MFLISATPLEDKCDHHPKHGAGWAVLGSLLPLSLATVHRVSKELDTTETTYYSLTSIKATGFWEHSALCSWGIRTIFQFCPAIYRERGGTDSLSFCGLGG